MNVIQRRWRGEARRLNDVTTLEEGVALAEFMNTPEEFWFIGEHEDDPGIFLFGWWEDRLIEHVLRTDDPADYSVLRLDWSDPSHGGRLLLGRLLQRDWELDTSL